MPDFSTLFFKSKGQPIEYKGQTLVMVDYFPTDGASIFRLVMEMCNGHPVKVHSASDWSNDRGKEHRTADGTHFRTSEDGLAPWRDCEPPGRWRQAACLRLAHKDAKGRWQRGGEKNNAGEILIGEEKVNGKVGVALWQSNEWEMADIQVCGDAVALEICNAWDVGNGVMHSWHHGAAMIVEDIPNGRRYRCNDGEPDEDFDDIIFRIERLG